MTQVPIFAIRNQIDNGTRIAKFSTIPSPTDNKPDDPFPIYSSGYSVHNTEKTSKFKYLKIFESKLGTVFHILFVYFRLTWF